MSRNIISTPATPVSVPPNPNVILTSEQVAAWLQVAPRQVARLGVPQLKLGHKTKRYRASDVMKWLDRQGRRS